MKRFFSLVLLAVIFSTCSNEQPKKNVNPKKNANSIKAYKYKSEGKTDSAFKYFNIAKDEFLIIRDSIGFVNSLLNMSIIASDQGDYFGGQEISLNALNFLNENSQKHKWYVHSNYNSLGFANYRLRNYSDALRFYEAALKFATENKDRLLYLNNKAKVYEELKNYNAAIRIYKQVIKKSEKETVPYAQALANMASARWLQDSTYNAAPELLYALRINSRENAKWGLNFCYARLADFYGKKNSALAISYTEKMYTIAKELDSPYDQLEALYKLVKLSQTIESRKYFESYEKLDDSLQVARAKAKNQFALIRYNTLKLQKENAEKKYQLIWQKTILLGTITLLVLGAIFSVYWYNKRKKAHQKEKELEVKNTELKYVKKVHDRVANRVYNVMMEVENTGDLDKTTLADKLESIYKISRDISYESTDVDGEQMFAQQLHQMFISYASDVIAVNVHGNDEDLWQDVYEIVKSEIIIILQELMTNMMKHSRATAVQVDFKRVDNQIDIVYRDNGTGIVGEPIFKNGLTNTGNRIEEINGVINFDITVQRGLKIEISFPVLS